MSTVRSFFIQGEPQIPQCGHLPEKHTRRSESVDEEPRSNSARRGGGHIPI